MLLKIVRAPFHNQTKEYDEVVNFLYSTDLEAALQVLHYHKNREVSVYALELEHSLFKMHDEDINEGDWIADTAERTRWE